MEVKRIAYDLTVLHRTIKTGDNREILDLLQHQDFNLELTDSNGNTVLHLVVQNEKLTNAEVLEIVKTFLNLKIDPNVNNDAQETVLHLAIARRLKDVVMHLLKHNAKIDEETNQDNMITHFFIEHEYNKFKELFELKNDNSSFCDSEEAEKESSNFVDWLIENGFNFDSRDKLGRSALNLAIDRNLLHVLPILLKFTNDDRYLNGDYRDLIPSFMDKRFLVKPFYYKYIFRSLKVLMDKGLSIKLKNKKDVLIIEALIDEIPENNDGKSCAKSLFHSIICNCDEWSEYYPRVLDATVAKGADVNEPNGNGTSAVFWAIESKNLEMLKYLEEKGFDFTAKNSDGRSPLSELLIRANGVIHDNKLLEIAEFLIENGCDVNEKDNNGSSLLHFAAELSSTSSSTGKVKLTMAELCKRFGVDMNTTDVRKVYSRPSSTSALVRDTNTNRILGILLKHGARVHTRDRNGKSALCRAAMKMQNANVEELLEWGANVCDPCVLSLIPRLTYLRDRSLDPLIQHFIKLKAIGLPCPDDYRFHSHGTQNRLFHKCCSKEVMTLKRLFIDEDISLYDLLLMNPIRRYTYVENEKLKEIVDSPILQEQFPLYSVVILAFYRDIVSRKSLLEAAKKAWMQLIYLPDICVEWIFDYLDNMDLFNVIESFDET